jgi:two-component system chemotaxis response regulator CheY
MLVTAKVMIVEDRDIISQAIADMLAMSGYEVVASVEDGKSAIEAYASMKPDLVLMDLLLPDMSGIDVSRRILKMDPDAKLIAITATTKEGIREECKDAGLKKLIRKPFRMKELLSTIQDVLDDR